MLDVKNRETIADIEANNDRYCLQIRIEKSLWMLICNLAFRLSNVFSSNFVGFFCLLPSMLTNYFFCDFTHFHG